MKATTRKLLDTSAEVLNKHVASGTKAGALLTGDDRHVALELVNEILTAAAEGNTLVAAMESNGNLMGFVPRANVPLPELTPRGPSLENSVPPGPDDV